MSIHPSMMSALRTRWEIGERVQWIGALALQAWGPESESLTLKKLGTVTCIHNPSIRMVEIIHGLVRHGHMSLKPQHWRLEGAELKQYIYGSLRDSASREYGGERERHCTSCPDLYIDEHGWVHTFMHSHAYHTYNTQYHTLIPHHAYTHIHVSTHTHTKNWALNELGSYTNETYSIVWAETPTRDGIGYEGVAYLA